MNNYPETNRNDLHTQSKNKVFIGGLKGSTTQDTVLKVFSRFGAIKSVKMCADDKDPKKNKGYAVLEFVDP